MKKLSVLLLAASMVFGFSAMSAAEDKTIEERVKALEDVIGSFNIYGSARFQTFYNDSNLGPNSDDADLTWDSASNARMGATVSKEKISGVYEVGLDDDYGVYTRLIYATYNFGAGTLVIGQDYTPLSSMFYSNQVYGDDLGLTGWGAIYESRIAQIKLMAGGFEIAFVRPSNARLLKGESEAVDKVLKADTDVLMPKIEVRYHLEQEKFFADVFGGFLSYKLDDIEMSGVNYGDETVNSWVAGIGGGLKLDPAYIRAQAYYAQNARSFGLDHVNALGAYIDSAGKLVDEDNFGAHLVAGTMIDKYTIEAGVGYVTSERDASGFDKAAAMAYYLNAVIPIYGQFFVVPEIGVLDYGDDEFGNDTDMDTTYFGAKWQINF